jgi:hypothetical protein
MPSYTAVSLLNKIIKKGFRRVEYKKKKAYVSRIKDHQI